jgi:hypothetical protein
MLTEVNSRVLIQAEAYLSDRLKNKFVDRDTLHRSVAAMLMVWSEFHETGNKDVFVKTRQRLGFNKTDVQEILQVALMLGWQKWRSTWEYYAEIN